MFYVKLNEDGGVDRYPYTLTDLRLGNPGTSFAETISDETAASFGVYPVIPSDPPVETYTINLARIAVKQGEDWVEEWISTPATPEQIAERTEAKASNVRVDRNKRLADCDWTQGKDIHDAVSDAWAPYRQALRDITLQEGFPWEIAWPSQPS